MTVKCWICGHQVNLLEMNLMAIYERYLILTFLLSVLIRFRQYQTNVQFAWQFPQQWPSVLEVIKQNSSIFLKWTTLLPVGITLSVLLSHTICYRVIWSEAVVTPRQLQSNTFACLLVLTVFFWMVFLDLRVLFSSSQLDFAEIEANLTRGEFALNSKAMSALRVASLGFFNPRKYVESRVTDSLHAVRVALLAQLRRWSFHTAVRITFGFLLWLGYGRLSGKIRPQTYVVTLVLLAIWLAAAGWWSRDYEQPIADDGDR